MTRDNEQHASEARPVHPGQTARARRRILAACAATSAFGLVLLAAGFGQGLPSAEAQDPVNNLSPASRPRKNQEPKTPQKENTVTPSTATPPKKGPAADKDAIRPFRVNVAEEELTELRRRIKATKWPERETVADTSQGVQLATVQKLARYWATDYDWRKIEAKLNDLANFVTEIDGLDIHFIHVRSKHENALP